MKNIRIENFGPIKELDISIDDFNVFIGPQASGKSTIAKAIYYFYSIKDDLVRYIYDTIENEEELYEPTTNFKKRIRTKFVGFWGTTKHLKSFKIDFNYSTEKTIYLFLKDGYVNANFSQPFHDELNLIFQNTLDFLKKNKGINKAFISTNDIFVLDSEKRAFYKRIEELVDKLFSESRTPIYIPAGRSLLSTLSEQLQKTILGRLSSTSIEKNIDFDPFLLDYPLQAFIERISGLKTLYSKSLDEIIEDKKKFTSTTVKLDIQSLNQAKKIIKTILKAEYKYDKEGERLYIGKNNYVKLSFASSGQQESIWILLQLFALILNNTKSIIIIEEPEAHLYPIAQKDIISLIALLSNLNNNQIIITTHSPYILTSINNLAYAFLVSKNNAKKISSIIDPSVWIKTQSLKAYFVEEGNVRNIIDEEFQLIKAEEIDYASSLINEEFGKMESI